MQGLLDFLSFNFFISPYVLIACYYVGAIGIPFASWFSASWVKSKFSSMFDAFESSQQTSKQTMAQASKSRSRIILISLFALFFICMEIAWRILFEFLIAYLQIREALMELVSH